MDLANSCIFIAFLLPYIFIILAKVHAPGMNNETPRVALAHLTGWKQRAFWAHQNAFEAFPPFAAGVILAQFIHGPSFAVNVMAVVFVIARILHGVFYISNHSLLRSLAWFVGIACVVGLFIAAC